jgi:hypothetical protein
MRRLLGSIELLAHARAPIWQPARNGLLAGRRTGAHGPFRFSSGGLCIHVCTVVPYGTTVPRYSCTAVPVRLYSYSRTYVACRARHTTHACTDGTFVHLCFRHCLACLDRQCMMHWRHIWQGSASCTAFCTALPGQAVHDALPCHLARQCFLHCLAWTGSVLDTALPGQAVFSAVHVLGQ